MLLGCTAPPEHLQGGERRVDSGASTNLGHGLLVKQRLFASGVPATAGMMQASCVTMKTALARRPYRQARSARDEEAVTG
jgi:hypothetical protein